MGERCNGPAAAYVAAIDQGTTSTRFILYDSNAKIVASHQLEFKQIYPQAGWVEHDPMEILNTVKVCMTETYKKVQGAYVVKGIGITNQRETTIIWSKSTGKPYYNAIVWMDGRTSSICKRLEESLSGGTKHFVESCGLPISTYFSALKLLWLLENVAEVKTAVLQDDALFGTVDTWLIWNMTGGVSGGLHVTDCSNAARTMLMNLKTLNWDKNTLENLGIPIDLLPHVYCMLPRIISNAEVIGNISEGWPSAGVCLAGCLGDQHAAMLGQLCKKGEAKSTYGTGCFILLNTGEEIVPSTHGLLTTVAYKLGPTAATYYALEGSIAIAGAAVQWLRDNLGIIKTASEIEELAASVESTGGVYFVPAFNGLFAPRWRDDARGVCVGITRFTHKGHLARSVLESMCFQAKEVLDSMLKDANVKEKEKFKLRVDGGATVNNLLMQIQADLLGTDVVRPKDIETTALGAAYAAGLAVGVWKEEQFTCGEHEDGAVVFTPNIDKVEREKRYNSWCKAVERCYQLSDLA